MRQLTPPEIRDHCRNLCRTDLYFLLRYGLQRPDLERQWLFDRCREVQISPNGHLDLWAREHYKSTIITFALTIQDILASHGDDPLPEWGGREPTFGIFSCTRPIAKTFLRQIKTEFEGNRLLKDWFPDVVWDNPQKESPKWSEDDGIVLKRRSNARESTVEAWGLVDGQPTSKHFYGLLYDDVVTHEHVTTSDMMKKTLDRWEVSLNLGVDGGFKRYCGTRYADGDTYGSMIERGVVDVRIYPATEDGTAKGIPVLVSEETLDEKRKSMSAYNFSCQMLLDPIPDDTAYFHQDWLQEFDFAKGPEHGIILVNGEEKTVTFWGASDYAVTEEGGDYTVHGVVAVDSDENIYVVDWWREQANSLVWVRQFIRMGMLWKVVLWGEEAGQINKGVGPFLVKMMHELRAYFTREQYVPSANKPTRAQSIRGRAAMGKLFIRRGMPWTKDLVMECLRFPIGKQDDQVDVLSLFGLMLDKMWGKLVRKPKGAEAGTAVGILQSINAFGNGKLKTP